MRPVPVVLAFALLCAACSPGPVRTDRVRIFDVAGKPESEWGYDPAWIEVSQGTTVTFTNGGTVLHTVTSDDPGRAFDAGALPGAAASIRFDRPGNWPFHCGVHPAMKGLVHVCDGACR